MKKQNKIIVLLLVLVGFAAVLSGLPRISKALSSSTLLGWLWGGADDGSGVSSGVGWISVSNTVGGGSIPYGLNVPFGDGDLSGTAYAENMGYLAFDNSAGLLAGCPDGNCRAYRSGDKIMGWARFADVAQSGSNAGGNLGWIHLSGTALNGSPYGVTVGTDGKLSGYAWSDEFGAIDFGRAVMGASLRLCQNGILYTSSTQPQPGAPITFAQGESRNLTAYYDSGSGCSGASVASLATFVSSEPAIGILSGSDPKILLGAVPDASSPRQQADTATVTVTYSGQAVVMPLSVLENCTPASCSPEENHICKGEVFNVTDGCGFSHACTGIRSCSNNWKEVAPGV